jgi:soluble lytic murein transglycosylase
MMGAWYIDYLISKFEGDMILALAAYNAGPAKVQNWLNDTSLTDNGQKLIQIPYKETENYVKKINSAYEQYKELYN